MFKKILLVLAIVAIIFVVVVSLRPADFHVTRSTTIAAPPATIFPHINDLKKWQEWSPWAKIDPNCKVTFEGPVAGVGAIFRWDGNMQVGAGSMTETESQPNDRVQFKLDFLKPMQGTNTVVFTLKSEGAGTTVTWTTDGKNNFVGKAMGLFIDCDKMCGDQFEKGFADLKTIAENEVKK